MRILALAILIWVSICSKGSKTVYTQVTFMYNIKRGDIKAYKRSYSLYLFYFDQMLSTDSNLIIFGAKELADFVWQRRKEHNTVFIQKSLDQYRNYWYYRYTHKLRDQFMNDPNFIYKKLPQFVLEDYNTIMLSKFYLLTDALKYDKFNTDVLIWSDGGYMHIFPRNLVWPQNVIKKYHQLVQPQWIFFTYFEKGLVMAGYQKGQFRYIDRKVEPYELALAGHMAGYIQFLRDIKCAFENLLRITLQNGDMNSDESVVTLMPIRFPFLLPTTSNIYLDNFVNKFHIYEDVSRIPQHPRHFKGIFKQEGVLEIIQNQIVNRYKEKPKAEDQNQNNTLTVTSLEQMQALNARDQRSMVSLRRLKNVLVKKLASEKRIAQTKLVYLAVFFVLYLIAAVKNICLKKKADRIFQKVIL